MRKFNNKIYTKRVRESGRERGTKIMRAYGAMPNCGATSAMRRKVVTHTHADNLDRKFIDYEMNEMGDESGVRRRRRRWQRPATYDCHRNLIFMRRIQNTIEKIWLNYKDELHKIAASLLIAQRLCVSAPAPSPRVCVCMCEFRQRILNYSFASAIRYEFSAHESAEASEERE